ncbi:hypothetical protein AAG570_013620 [Ranatra chinensis]|uniref:BHLH domain-containing protein n=1 Tax=Ranatra chinensis TaxID=642074 RepID=A0ABD0Z0Z9_9HEMI
MKAVNSASVAPAATTPQGTLGGRVQRQRNRDVENEEIQVYLTKLKELVPFMPKNRKLTKLEVIQYVIDYICDLQDALETQPGVGGGAAAAAAAAAVIARHGAHGSPRQPLGVLAPNTLVTSCSTQEASTAPVHLLEKVSTPTDTRPVSC